MPFVLKLLLVPSLIALVTLAGRRWGPSVAGWLSAFPIVAGPILLAIALEQGSDFAAVAAAANTLLAVLAIVVFSIVYARIALRPGAGVALSLCVALPAWGLAVAVLQGVQLPVWLAFGAVMVALLAAPRLIGSAFAPSSPPVAANARPARDLPWRMLAGAALTVAVTQAAGGLGPKLSGLFAMFPVMSTVLVGFSHRASGPGFAVALLRGMVGGYYAFAVFCLVLALLLPGRAPGLPFVLATACALAVQLGVRALIQARGRP